MNNSAPAMSAVRVLFCVLQRQYFRIRYVPAARRQSAEADDAERLRFRGFLQENVSMRKASHAAAAAGCPLALMMLASLSELTRQIHQRTSPHHAAAGLLDLMMMLLLLLLLLLQQQLSAQISSATTSSESKTRSLPVSSSSHSSAAVISSPTFKH